MADVTRSVNPVASKTGATESQLDALAPQGHHCLHQCRWPGSRKGTIDHVVIGPSGVWIVRDVRVSDAGVKDADVRIARDQAAAVEKAIGGRAPHVLLSIEGAPAPGGADERDGVLIVGANRAADIVRYATVVLRPEGVDRIAAKAHGALEPKRSTPRGGVPDFIPDWVVAGTPVPKGAKPPKTKRGRRVRRVLVLVALLAGVAALVPTALDALSEDESPATTETTIDVAFECRHPGTGWSQVVAWPALRNVRSIAWASAPEGPWTAMTAFGGFAVRDGVVPSDLSHVRVVRATDAGVVVESMATAAAPSAPC